MQVDASLTSSNGVVVFFKVVYFLLISRLPPAEAALLVFVKWLSKLFIEVNPSPTMKIALCFCSGPCDSTWLHSGHTCVHAFGFLEKGVIRTCLVEACK